jgi:TusA-related sulfurtransferase
MSLAQEKPSKTIDVTGQVCPYPLIETRNALKALTRDQILEILTDSEHSVFETIPMLCEKKGYPCENVPQGNLWRVYIKKTGDK